MTNTATKSRKDYDTVYRHGRNVFTGVPIAKLHHGVWYWPDYQTAHDFAVAFDLPIEHIRQYANGWAQAAIAPRAANQEGNTMTNTATKSREVEREEAHNKTGQCAFEAIKEMVDDLNMANNSGDSDAAEACENRIQEDPLSVMVRESWHEVGKPSEEGAEEYEILLSWGGPATRIYGMLNNGEPQTARLQVQDWGTPWTEWCGEGWSEDVLLDYARCFYFGE